MEINGEKYGPPHAAFNEEIYRWTLTIPAEKWFKVSSVKKMPQDEFIECIKYLICCGEPLLFSEDFSAFKRVDYGWIEWRET